MERRRKPNKINKINKPNKPEKNEKGGRNIWNKIKIILEKKKEKRKKKKEKMAQSTFPLFSILEQKLEEEQIKLETPLTDIQKQFLCDQLKNMDDIGTELVYAVIRFYQLQYDKGNIMELPYLMKKQKTGNVYKLEVNDLPLKLQHLILIFIMMHSMNSMNSMNSTNNNIDNMDNIDNKEEEQVKDE
jgi:hypothetical protein